MYSDCDYVKYTFQCIRLPSAASELSKEHEFKVTTNLLYPQAIRQHEICN
jgi:hypothetical protein